MVATIDKADYSEPIIRRKSLTAVNRATMSTEVDYSEYGTMTFDEPSAHGGSDGGPSPLQGVLGALCACEGVTFRRTADEMGFSYSRISFAAAYAIDIRGRQGVRGVVPHFRSVKVEATVSTDESEERLRDVAEETEARCPVFNLIRDANVRVDFIWIRAPAEVRNFAALEN